VLTATDQSRKKIIKEVILLSITLTSGDVMVGNITFSMIFAVFDPLPLTIWIYCSF